jgi:hypothetical protein
VLWCQCSDQRRLLRSLLLLHLLALPTVLWQCERRRRVARVSRRTFCCCGLWAIWRHRAPCPMCHPACSETVARWTALSTAPSTWWTKATGGVWCTDRVTALMGVVCSACSSCPYTSDLFVCSGVDDVRTVESERAKGALVLAALMERAEFVIDHVRPNAASERKRRCAVVMCAAPCSVDGFVIFAVKMLQTSVWTCSRYHSPVH